MKKNGSTNFDSLNVIPKDVFPLDGKESVDQGLLSLKRCC